MGRAGQDADAIYLTDEDDTVIDFSNTTSAVTGDNRSAVLHFGELRPSIVRAHAHYPSCRIVSSAAVQSWDAQLSEFNYEESGGVMNASGLREADLESAEPAFEL